MLFRHKKTIGLIALRESNNYRILCKKLTLFLAVTNARVVEDNITFIIVYTLFPSLNKQIADSKASQHGGNIIKLTKRSKVLLEQNITYYF
ncbi:hypothetical protein GCM10007216_18340 [Thalassobacillus devorans]|uniref:Uncharacterized protein n=1 Tax=Thalassobacillus devorans TaxID=279813 RepID=A0ABQ1P0M0_9BACI|nr:hypothetical protein GCM10007216_18340 [Thalassobacillus devorans]